MKSQVDAAVETGTLTLKQAGELLSLFYANLAAFGLKQSLVQLSSLEPMELTLKPGCEPVIMAPHPLSSVKKEAMRQKLQSLNARGMIERDLHPKFVSPAFIRRGKWRLVIDMRKLNEMIEPIVPNLPSIEMQLSCVVVDY